MEFVGAGASEDEPYTHLWYVGLKFDMTKLKQDGKKNPNVAAPVKLFKNRYACQMSPTMPNEPYKRALFNAKETKY